MKVGDRIKVYEVLTDGEYQDRIMTPGTFRAGRPDGKLFYILSDNDTLKERLMYSHECRHVATMRITKLK